MSVAVLDEREATSPALERLHSLCDPGSLELIRTGVVSSAIGERARPDDGVLAGAGRVGGRTVFCYSQDPAFMGGSLGEAHADSIVRVLDLAGRGRAPVVGFVESGGARLQEGHGALGGYGRIFRRTVELSRRVPQVSVIAGVSAGGGAYSPALTDFIVMAGEGRMFLTGPKVVEAALGERVSMEDLGGPRVQVGNGVAQLAADGIGGAVDAARELIGLLPQAIGEPPPAAPPAPAPGGDPDEVVPAERRRVYDVRELAARLLDRETLLELSDRWAPNMVTALGRLDGRAVAVLANQPRRLGGVIDSAAAEKAAAFVERADRLRLPLLVIVDTPGFMPGLRQERAGVIRHGAGLLRAFAAATVPKLTLIARKAFGGAVITMNSKDLGADLVFAWPGAEIGIMAASEAVAITESRRLAELDAEGSERLAREYAERHLGAQAAAAAGFVDEVIEPAQTRARLSWALSALEGR
ncbi:MAG: methylmalonyl-CoA carboxyltransferase [Actinobacteria bacterium]|nr:methylmalonyl-CoA carboxyltransferase [Actinomycetota bacterium]